MSTSPVLLVILDGWGYRENKNNNAIAAANKPNWDYIWNHYPHTLISGSGHCVGLPEGQMGNSEVGHLNMGSGRIVVQDLTRIDQAIDDQSFFQNPVLIKAIELAKKNNSQLHLLGLLSNGGVHSHDQHFHAMLKLCAQYQISPAIHAFLDGRDTPPASAANYIQSLENLMQELKFGKFASIIGRYYAMDRDQRWDRIEKAFDLLTLSIADYTAKDAITGLQMAYARGETDEFVHATRIISETDTHATEINDGDVVVFMNFRSDRARELTQAFIEADFSHFQRKKRPKLSDFISLTEYDPRFQIDVGFPPTSLKNIFAEYISNHGLKQLRLAETEKYAHVTFFFNGGIEKPFPLEDRVLIPSKKIKTYDMQPEMSAYEITDTLLTALKKQTYDVVIVNFANPDMVGHSGNFTATVKAIETIDVCLGKIFDLAKQLHINVLITADHGNAELMYDEEHQQPHTAHTNDPVPLVYIGKPAVFIADDGKLSDIAPTMLKLLDLPIPAEMTGKPLLKLL